MEYDLRRQATDTVLAKFDGRSFAWGRFDCVRLAASSMKALGHKVSLSKGGAYSSARGAVRALRRAGYDNPVEALDARLVRIPPASAWPGDIVAFESGEDWPSLMVALYLGHVLGFMPDAAGALRCGVIAPEKLYVAAWRVPLIGKAA
jgi:hypothetical protein